MLGSELRALREARGLSARTVAKAAGISHTSLAAIERGERYPSLRTLEALAEFLEVRIVIDMRETFIEPVDE